ncbi:MAG: SDR family oxidoreductase [Desulfarculaceae bacterium]|nr:SDR family oxidoreductase [Desulfarculaceae bacterium]MCF8071786.1 SDR family oxidoreductase [Desulfarculaceae bacterium]MCF8101336.1 SDR family oxidoreductase [Desulfarculaceae bacterium]MCF8117295.1 SDR family oxidoreductase [Desulfarculaceae bacterium]
MDLQSEVALVTGAGRGIGLATAEKLGASGAAVVLADQDLATAEAGALAIEGAGGRALAVQMDVRLAGDWTYVVETAVKRYGPLTALVNNAGFDRPGGVAKVSQEDFEAVLSVHLTACLLGMRAALPAFERAGYGAVVNVSSVYAKIGGHGEAAYSAAKAGMVGLTKSAAREFARHGVRVNCVLPGLTDTPAIRGMMSDKVRDKLLAETPLRRMATPGEIANVIAFLCSGEASFVTGAAWEVSGGWNM